VTIQGVAQLAAAGHSPWLATVGGMIVTGLSLTLLRPQLLAKLVIAGNYLLLLTCTLLSYSNSNSVRLLVARILSIWTIALIAYTIRYLWKRRSDLSDLIPSMFCLAAFVAYDIMQYSDIWLRPTYWDWSGGFYVTNWLDVYVWAQAFTIDLSLAVIIMYIWRQLPTAFRAKLTA
jgi:hypothetical protein